MTHLLPRTSPAAVGLDPAAVDQLIERFDALDTIHSFLLVRDGSVVAEGSWAPHTPDRPHMLFSLSKSFTSTAVGFAIEEGRLGLDDRVIDLLADLAPSSPGENLAAMRVRHLLTMTSGHAEESLGEIGPQLGRQVLSVPVPYEPGTRFVYNTGATYLAGLIVQRLTGQRLLDYLRPRLFEPLGVTTATWEQDPDGYDVAGFGLTLTIEELAAFAQLYAQRGVWRGRQLVPATWVDAATALAVPSGPNEAPDWAQGYGFQFWRCRHDAFRGDGAFGQFAVVWPRHRLVLALTAGTADMQSILDALWAFAPTPVEATGDDRPVLAERRLATPVGAASSPIEASVLGVPFTLRTPLSGISSLTVRRDGDDRWLLELPLQAATVWPDPGDPAPRRELPLGFGEWLPSDDVAATAAWRDESTMEIRIAYLGTPFVRTLVLRFDGPGLTLRLDQNVAFTDTHLGTGTATPPVQ